MPGSERRAVNRTCRDEECRKGKAHGWENGQGGEKREDPGFPEQGDRVQGGPADFTAVENQQECKDERHAAQGGASAGNLRKSPHGAVGQGDQKA